MSILKSLKEKKLVIVLNSFVFYGGATKSIFNYYRFNVNKGEKVEIIDLQTYKGVIKFILATCVAPQITVNGLASMNSWIVLVACYFRRDIIFYCHEAEYAFEAYKKRSTLKYGLLKLVLPKLLVACVSEWQCEYICSTFGVLKSAIIYENIDLDFSNNLDASKINIVMLGYRMHRKGVDLFSHVSDLAKKNNPALTFTWIGSGDASGLYLSPNVNWMGESLKPDLLLQQCDLLFLSSMDDPFPLACLEALGYKKKCVVYKHTGTAEVIRNVPGCAVYDEYKPEAALEAIIKALNTDLDISEIEYIQKNISSVAGFAYRFDEVLNKQKLRTN